MTGHITVGVDIRRGIIMQLDKNKPDKKDDLGCKKENFLTKNRPKVLFLKKDDLKRRPRSCYIQPGVFKSNPAGSKSLIEPAPYWILQFCI